MHTILPFRPLLLMITAFCCSSLFCFSQSFSGPEGMAYYPGTGSWFITNNNGEIIEYDINGSLSTFTVAGGTHGIEIVGDVLYANDGDRVLGYSLVNGENVADIDLNASFLNGMAYDGLGYLYVTDFSTKRIYKINLSDLSYITLVANTVQTPNGIVYDPMNNRLVMVTWGANASIYAIDPITGNKMLITSTNLGNCDGIVTDGCGTFYVSAWNPTGLYKFPANFTQGYSVLTTDLASPADIGYDNKNYRIGIPNTGFDDILIYDLNPLPPTIGLVDTIHLVTPVDSAFHISQSISFDHLIATEFIINNSFPELTAELEEVNDSLIISGSLSEAGQFDCQVIASNCLGLSDTLTIHFDVQAATINGVADSPIYTNQTSFWFDHGKLRYSAGEFFDMNKMVQILDINGRFLYVGPISGFDQLSYSFPRGMYFLLLTQGNYGSVISRYKLMNL